MSRTVNVIREWMGSQGDRLAAVWDAAIDSEDKTSQALAELVEGTTDEIHRLTNLMRNHIQVNFRIASSAADWLNGPVGGYTMPVGRPYDLEAEARAIHSMAMVLSSQLTTLDDHVGRLA